MTAASVLVTSNEFFRASAERRLYRLLEIGTSPQAALIEMELCRRDIFHWLDNWAWTYDPRLVTAGKSAHIPLDLFLRQRQFIEWVQARLAAHEDGLAEKSRDMGFTWLTGSLAIHNWLFLDGFATAFGSRKEEYVDRKGDPKSIFEKMRMLYRNLPKWMMPLGFDEAKHDNYMRLINPRNGNVISGEAGDQMGRGGRVSQYNIDEAAFLEHGDMVDAATSATCETRIWGSTVNGLGNTFANKRHGGSFRPDQIFRLHYKDDPRKDAAWATKKKASLEAHVWASEYEIDYSASVEGICIPGKWVEASLEIGRRWRTGQLVDRDGNPMAVEPAVHGIGGLDVGAGGKGKSVFIARFGPIVHTPVSWGNPDTIETAHKALDEAAAIKLRRSDGHDCAVRLINYDAPGVGTGVSSALRDHDHTYLRCVGINTGIPASETQWPDGEIANDKFANLKAELWWLARAKLKAAHELLLWLNGEPGGHPHGINDIVILPALDSGKDAVILAGQLSMPKTHKNEKGKMALETKAALAIRGIASPDHADSFVLTMQENSSIEVWERLANAA